MRDVPYLWCDIMGTNEEDLERKRGTQLYYIEQKIGLLQEAVNDIGRRITELERIEAAKIAKDMPQGLDIRKPEYLTYKEYMKIRELFE